MITSLSCIGFRGFEHEEIINLAQPTGIRGSGLTVVVGPNGGGKSTLVECFQKLAINSNVSFTVGKRNKKAGDKVTIKVVNDKEETVTLSTVESGGSEAMWSTGTKPRVYYLPARRVFNPYFGRNLWNRDTYIHNPQITQFRASTIDNFSSRLFDISKSNDKFNQLFWKILGHRLEWTIDQEDSGNYYVKIKKGDEIYHNSDGLGEGIVSLLFITDALFQSNPDELICIDEPELSLHPQLQARLLDAIMEVTKHSQVVISTHSPSMVSLESVVNGGNIARVHEEGFESKINMIDSKCREIIHGTLDNRNNPHIFGNDARSCFFAEDGIIITEGQEDVVLYPKINEKLGLNATIPFFGFGAGGASRIIDIAYIFMQLGFKKVGAIYDGDKQEDYKTFLKTFTQNGYKAWIIPADDIRDKKEYTAKAKTGLLDEHGDIKQEYADAIKQMFTEILSYSFSQ